MPRINSTILIAGLLAISISSACNQSGETGNKEKEGIKKEQEPGKTSAMPATDSLPTKQKEAGNSTSNNLDFLKNLDGKYPYEVKLLDNPALKKRLEDLLGSRFTFLKDTWAVETPIEIKNNVFVATGCQAHNCSSTNFIIVVDLTKNVIYAGVREEDKVKTYSEDGTSSLQLTEWAK